MATMIFAATAVTDQDLSKKVNEKIKPGWFSSGYDKVDAQVQNGVVTLSGYVKTNEDKEKLEREVRNMDGVTSVTSKIRVEEPTKGKEARKYPQDTYGSSADDQLNKKIRDNVSNGWIWDSYKDLSLNTSNGDVTLEGSVKDLKDQQKIMNEIQKIPGVKTVKSNLRVQKEDE